MRLIDYLKEKYPDRSRRTFKRALEQGACKVNGVIIRMGSHAVNPQKDKIEYQDITPEAKPMLLIEDSRIKYEDEYILIYDKPAGYSALATAGKHSVHLHGELKKYLRKREGKDAFIDPVHRLDKNTSGLIIFAKSKDSLNKFSEMFKEKNIYKEYEAIIDGELAKKEGLIENYVKLDKKGAGWQKWQVFQPREAKEGTEEFQKVIKKKNAKKAITKYKLVSKHSSYSFVKLMPKTGRTHQLRIHMAFIGNPILGDNIYSTKFKTPGLFARHLLHAAKLSFKHPLLDKEIKVHAQLPKDMAELL